MRKSLGAIGIALVALIGSTAAVQASALPQSSVQAIGQRGSVTFPTTPVNSFVLKAQTMSRGVTGGNYSVTRLSDNTTVLKGSIMCVLTGVTDADGRPAAIVGGVITSGSDLDAGYSYFAVAVAVGPSSSYVTLTNLDTSPLACADQTFLLTAAYELPILNGSASIKVKS